MSPQKNKTELPFEKIPEEYKVKKKNKWKYLLFGLFILGSVGTGIKYYNPNKQYTFNKPKCDSRGTYEMFLLRETYKKISGENRIVSNAESRDFLNKIGYKEPIDINETVWLEERFDDQCKITINAIIGNANVIKNEIPIEINKLEKYLLEK